MRSSLEVLLFGIESQDWKNSLGNMWIMFLLLQSMGLGLSEVETQSCAWLMSLQDRWTNAHVSCFSVIRLRLEQWHAVLLDSLILKKLDMRRKIPLCGFIKNICYTGFVVSQNGELLTSEN